MRFTPDSRTVSNRDIVDRQCAHGMREVTDPGDAGSKFGSQCRRDINRTPKTFWIEDDETVKNIEAHRSAGIECGDMERDFGKAH